MPRKSKINSTEESIFTLLSIFILIQQSLESIYGKEEILNSEFNTKSQSFHNLMTDTIHEALNYQILIKACAFIDEWNQVFGVKTEKKDELNIRTVKKIAKPALKQISEWKQLRDFRNEAIAHNHRDRTGRNIYLNAKGYHSPDTDDEIYLMVFCIKKAIDVVSFFFQEEMKNVIKEFKLKKKLPRQKRITGKKIKNLIKVINETVDGPISDIMMKQNILSALVEANKKKTIYR